MRRPGTTTARGRPPTNARCPQRRHRCDRTCRQVRLAPPRSCSGPMPLWHGGGVLKFGTDGVRGVANLDLTPEVVLALGRAAARVLPSWRFVVGRDTRRSGPLLEAALVAGLTSEGADV